MNRNLVGRLVCLALCGLGPTGVEAQETRPRPNVLLILADDQGQSLGA